MKLTRRFLALLLALSMSLSMVTPAYASEAEIIDETEPVVVVEETEAAAVETTEAETEAPETEAPVVVETEAPVVEETEEVVIEEIAASQEAALGSTYVDTTVNYDWSNPLYPEWTWSEDGKTATADVTLAAGMDQVIYAVPYTGTLVVGATTYTIEGTLEEPHCAALSNPLTEPFTFNMTLTLAEPEKEEYAVNYDVQLALGENALTLLTTAVTTVYEFSPEEAGVYQFVADDANALVGYWGAGTFFVSDQTENKSNVLEYTLANAGPSIMVGVSGVESCTLTVTRTGDAVVAPSYEKVDYVNVVTPADYTMPEEATDLVYVDVTDDVADAAVLGEDGYYHLNAADGPVLYADLGMNAPYGAPLAGATAYGAVKIPEYDAEGNMTALVNYLPAFEAYAACTATVMVGEAEASLYPLTEDLMVMFQKIGADKGWYDADTTQGFYLFEGKTVDEETAWLFNCCYSENAVSGGEGGAEDTVPGLADNDWQEAAIGGGASATYTYTAHSDGSVKMYLDYGVENVDIIVTNGKKTYTLLEDGVDNYGLELTVDVKAEDVLTIEVVDTSDAPARNAGWAFVFTYPLGSEQNPIYPEWNWNEEYTECDYSVKVAKKSSVWVMVNGGDMLLTVNGESVEVKPTMNAYGFEAYMVKLENTTSKAKTFKLAQTYSLGAPENPEVLKELSYGELSLAEGDENGYSYSYVAEDDCTYTFYIGNITEGITADIIVNNETSYDFKQLSVDGVDNYGLEMYVDVKAGDVLKINVFVQGSYDENWNYIVPAADLSWTAMAQYPEGSKKNPNYIEWMWNDAWTEGTASVTVPAGTTQWFTVNDGDSVITVDGEEVALEAIANKWGGTTFVFSLTNATEAEATYELALGYALGSQQNPEPIYDFSKLVVNLEEGDQNGYTYILYNKGAKGTLTFEGVAKNGKKTVPFDVILQNQNTYESASLAYSEDGTVSVKVNPRDVVTIQVSTIGEWDPVTFAQTFPAAKVTLTGTFEYPLGSQMNPDKLTIGDYNTAAIEEGNMDGYLFSWTAHMDGMLEIYLYENENWTAQLNNLTAGIYGDMRYSDDGGDPAVGVFVSKGDEIQLMVNTYDPENRWNNPAGEIVVGCGFSVVDDVASGKSLTLKFADPATGKTVSAKKVKWEIADAYVINPYAEQFEEDYEVHFTDVSAYATIKNGKLSTKKCGDTVYLTVLGTYNGLTIPYHIEMLPAASMLSIWETYYDYDEDGNIIDTWHQIVQGNWVWNGNGATEEDVPYMGWDLDAFSYPSNASQKVTWKSSNKKIATIDENGVVGFVWNAKKGRINTGTVTITATAADGSGKKASFKLTVTADKFPEYFELVRVDGKAFEQGDYLYDEEVINPETGETEYVPVYEKVMYIAPGETIKLKTNVDPTAGKKYQKADWGWWGDVMFTMKKLSGNQYSVKASKDAHDGAWCYVETRVPYCGYEQVKVVVKNPVEKKLEIYWLDKDHYNTWNHDFDVHEFDCESEDGWNAITMKAVLIGSDGSVGVVDADWTTSNKKVAAPEEVNWDEPSVNYNLTGKLGSFKATATYEDAEGNTYKDSLSISISDFSKYVNSLEIVVPEANRTTTWDWVEVWVDTEDGGYWDSEYMEVPAIVITAGQSIKLKAQVNASAKNKKVAWTTWDRSVAKISSSGKLTAAKDITEETMTYVQCWPTGNNTVGFVKIPVIVKPKATNVHARMITEDGTPFYVSNTTQTVGAWEGDRIEISALVYPFEARQDVTWKSNKTKIVKIVEEFDEETGKTRYFMEFTGKTGKVTITATANDGSKEKATFTLNVVAPSPVVQ